MESQPAVVPPANRPAARHAPTAGLEPAPSKAAIAGHPIHPMLIPFPVALLSLVPVTDIVFAVTDETFWSSVSYYLLWGGLVSAGLAAVFGLIDFIGVPRVRTVRAGWAHMLLNVAIVMLSVVNLWLRRGDTIEHVLPSGLIVSLVAAGLLMASGWYGGELSYRHKVGVIP
jgi:uncharacterized membrane protein